MLFRSDRLRAEWEPVVIRAGITTHHYRTEWEWDDGLMARSAERVERWRAAVGGPSGDCLETVRERLADDLDTPGALSALDEAAGRGEDVSRACELLGLRLG